MLTAQARLENRSINVDPKNPRGIVWLASFPRSGNTWVRIFLTNLRRVIDRDESPLDLNRLDRTFSINDSGAPLYEKVLGVQPVSAGPAAILNARPKVLSDLVQQHPGVILLKTHNANIMVQGTRFIPPDVSAGAIYLVRNPLDVAISNAAFRDISIDQAITDMGTSGLGTETTAEYVFELIGSWSENVATWTTRDSPSLLVVRYEDMVAEPIPTFGAIARHVLMQHTPGQLEEAIRRSSFKALSAIEQQSGFKEKLATADRFFRKGSAEQWRDALTPAQVERVVSAHGAQMARFGYLPQ